MILKFYEKDDGNARDKEKDEKKKDMEEMSAPVRYEADAMYNRKRKMA